MISSSEFNLLKPNQILRVSCFNKLKILGEKQKGIKRWGSDNIQMCHKSSENISGTNISFTLSSRKNTLLHYMGKRYVRNNLHGQKVYWKCTKWHSGCKARAITWANDSTSVILKNSHNH